MKKTTGSGERLGLLERDEPEDLFPFSGLSEGKDFRSPNASSADTSDSAEPFLRTAQRVSVRRRRGSRFGWKFALRNSRTRWIVAGVALLVIVLGGAIAMGTRSVLLHNRYFLLQSVDSIQVVGNRVVSTQEVMAPFSTDIGHSSFSVPLAQRKAQLEQIPWVRLATVMRLWPNRLRVSLTERVPVGFVRDGNVVQLVDDQGMLLPLVDAASQHYSFPILTGITAADPVAVREAVVQRYIQFAKALDAGGGRISATLSEVDLTDPEDIRAEFEATTHQPLVYFGNADFLARYRAYKAHLPEWLAQYPQLRSVDMRYGKQVVLDTGTTPTQSGALLPLSAQLVPAATIPSVGAAPASQTLKPSARSRANSRSAVRSHAVKHAPERGHIVLHPLMHIVKGA